MSVSSQSEPNYLGVDFSGGAAAWKERCSRQTVWIATIERSFAPILRDIRPVQQLAGQGAPFNRLVELLSSGKFEAAAIDAPFSIPSEYLSPGGHRELLARVAALPCALNRPFPAGAALVEIAVNVEPLRKFKPHRETERAWAARSVNTRSTLWNGPRPGAPFTIACLALLARAGRPVWPWNSGPGMLVEAFPAAQLCEWGLPHSGYGKPDQQNVRQVILNMLAERLEFNLEQRELMLHYPDALDAVIAEFAAIAADRQGRPTCHPADGLIAVSKT